MQGMNSTHAEHGASGQTTRPPIVQAGEDIWAPDLARRRLLSPCAHPGLDHDTAEMLSDWEAAQERRSR